jgi:hypothetical protein
MLEDGFLRLPVFKPETEKYQRNSIPIAFLSTCLENVSEDSVKEFWIQMNENISVNFRQSLEEHQPDASYERLELNDFDSVVRQSELQYQHIYEDTRYVTALDEIQTNGRSFKENTDILYDTEATADSQFMSLPKELRRLFDPKFSLKLSYHSHDPRVEPIIRGAWDNMMSKCGEIFDENVLRPDAPIATDFDNLDEDFFDGLSVMKRAAVENEKYRPKVKEAVEAALSVETPEELQQVTEQFDQYLDRTFFKHRNRIHWVPVIIGLDGEPFFPTSGGMDLLTAETVTEAKQEYLNSIPDEEARKQISENMYDQILLRFMDPKTKQLIEGLYY